MASVYDRTDIYDLFDSPKKDAQTPVSYTHLRAHET